MFGWGPGYNGEDLTPIVDSIYKATTSPMDLYVILLINEQYFFFIFLL